MDVKIYNCITYMSVSIITQYWFEHSCLLECLKIPRSFHCVHQFDLCEMSTLSKRFLTHTAFVWHFTIVNPVMAS